MHDDLNGDWSAQMTVQELRSIVHTHMIASTLQEDGDTAIGRDYATLLRNDDGVRVEDLEWMGIRVVGPAAQQVSPDVLRETPSQVAHGPTG